MAAAAHLVVPRPFFFATKVNVSKRQNLGRLTALLILLIAALASPAFAAGRTTSPSDAADKVSEKISDIDFAKSPAENWVICIGINSYEDDRLPTLKFCENDARLVRDYFISKHGIKPEHAILMATSQSDPALSPTRVNINNTIKDVLAQASPDSMIVVYIASHGVTGAAPDRQRVAYLIPTDGDIEDLNGTALNLTQMNDYMQKGKADTTLLIADACRTPVDKKKGTRSAKGDADVDAPPKNKGHYFISSCSDSQVAYEMEDVKHGAFTHYLMEGLNGEAGDKNGQVTLPSLISYVKCNLREWAQRNGKQVMEPFINVNSWSGEPLVLGYCPITPADLGKISSASDEAASAISPRSTLPVETPASAATPAGQERAKAFWMLHSASVLDYAAEATPATTAEYQKSDALALEKIQKMQKVDDAREARKILAEHRDDPKAGELIRRYIDLLDARIAALR